MAALIWIKGDLIEQAITFGLRGLAAQYHPCMLCATTAEGMHDYDDVTLTDDLWGKMGPDEYEAACQACEIIVTLVDEHARQEVGPDVNDMSWRRDEEYGEEESGQRDAGYQDGGTVGRRTLGRRVGGDTSRGPLLG